MTVYIDACFSGASQGGSLIGGGSPVYAEPAMPKEVPETMTVFTVAASNQIASWDDKAKHGMFTRHLLNALYGAGDANEDGKVTATEAKDHLDAYMTDAVGTAYTRDQIADLTGDRGVVLSLAPGGKFPIRPRLRSAAQPFTVEADPPDARVRILNIAERYRTDFRPRRNGSTQPGPGRRRSTTSGTVFRPCVDTPTMRTPAWARLPTESVTRLVRMALGR